MLEKYSRSKIIHTKKSQQLSHSRKLQSVGIFYFFWHKSIDRDLRPTKQRMGQITTVALFYRICIPATVAAT